MSLCYIDTGVQSAAENMAIDLALLTGLGEFSDPIFHAYGWKGLCGTYGYFCKPEEWLHPQGLQAIGVELARRPTGGGITFHFGDLAFSFFLPAGHAVFSLSSLDNYAFVNSIVARAIERWSLSMGKQIVLQGGDAIPRCEGARQFCMAHPTHYDLLIDGCKVGGAAQRRMRHGYLHQGTIALVHPNRALMAPLFRSSEILDSIQIKSAPLLKDCSQSDLECARRDLTQLLYLSFEEEL